MKSIRKRLIRSFMLVAWSTALLSACAILLGVYLFAKALQLTMLFGEAGRFALMVERTDEGYRFRESRRPIDPRFETGSTDAYFQIWGPDGQTLAKSASLGRGELPTPPPAAPYPDDPNPLEAEELENAATTLPSGHPGELVWIRFDPMRGPGGPPPSPTEDRRLIIAVAMDNQFIWNALTQSAFIILVLLLIIMVGLRLAAQLVVVRGLAALNTLSDRVARLDESNFTQRFDDAPLPQETAPVARAINTLLDKAEAALERERRFSENAAHELRTPIAEIRAVADVSRRVGSLASLSAGMGEVVAVAMQMEATLSALLRISRRKTASDLDSIESVNCTALLSDAVTRRMHHAAEKSISLAFSPAATTPIRTERAMLTGVISNLLDNAVEYTPVGGDVSLSLQSDQKGITFSVVNGPVRLMPSDIPRLVEPFWRKDSTRGSGEHAGLGLALTKAMVDALGGAIDFALEPDARLRITVRIPGFPAATKSSDPPAAT